MIFDTDVLIWFQRGHRGAAEVLDSATQRVISVQTYLELIQNARSKTELRQSKGFLAVAEFVIVPITEEISRRAMVYLEEYGLSHSMDAGDALIAATAVELSYPLTTANGKHYRAVQNLDLRIFKP